MQLTCFNLTQTHTRPVQSMDEGQSEPVQRALCTGSQ